MTAPRPSVIPAVEPPEELLDALLYSASHDLRSPLLTLSLSGELIRESATAVRGAEAGGSATVALDALKQGAEDLERMLHALATMSRARRREQHTRHVPLRVLLGGQLVISDIGDLDQLVVFVDAAPVRELIDRLCGEDEPAEIQLTHAQSHVSLRIPSRAALPTLEASPLLELSRSLQIHAGTIVEELASLQIQLARQDIAMELADGAVGVWLPLSTAKPS